MVNCVSRSEKISKLLEETKSKVSNLIGAQNFTQAMEEWKRLFVAIRLEEEKLPKDLRLHKGDSLYNLAYLLREKCSRASEASYLYLLAYIEDLYNSDSFITAKNAPAYRELVKDNRFVTSQMRESAEFKVKKSLENNQIYRDPLAVLDPELQKLIHPAIKYWIDIRQSPILVTAKKAGSKAKKHRVFQIFVSHSKLDKETCDKFDTIAARIGTRVFRSEYETIEAPAWQTIKQEMENSRVLFLVVGPELVRAQDEMRDGWKFTQNWIAYEVGLACALGIDVWVVSENTKVNFPVPYLNNYYVGEISTKANSYLRVKLQEYLNGLTFSLGSTENKTFACPYEGCGATFNLHVMSNVNSVKCPTCLKDLKAVNGLLQKI